LGEKKSFLLYISSFKQIRKLTQEQKGVLLDAIMNFQEGIPLPDMDPLVDMCFGFIADDMQRDAEKYDEIVEKRRIAGRKGGFQKQANLANATFATNESSTGVANLANLAVNVDVNEDVNVNEDVDVDVNVKESGSDSSTEHTHTSFNRPTNPELAQEIIEKGYAMNAASIQGFIDYNEERGWKMDWREALRKWNQQERKQKPNKINFLNNAVSRSGTEWEENESNKAKLIAMQQ